MKFLVSTHQGQLYDEELDYVIVHLSDNEFAILKDHIPLVCVIPAGYIKMVLGTEELYLALSNGFLEFKNNVVTIIAQEAHVGKSEDSAREQLEQIRKDRLEVNRKDEGDFVKQELDLAENLKKAKAGNL